MMRRVLYLSMMLCMTLSAAEVEQVISFGPYGELCESITKTLGERCPSFTQDERDLLGTALAWRFANTYVTESSFREKPFYSYVPQRFSRVHFEEERSFKDTQLRMKVIKKYGDTIRSTLYTCGVVVALIKKGGKAYRVIEDMSLVGPGRGKVERSGSDA